MHLKCRAFIRKMLRTKLIAGNKHSKELMCSSRFSTQLINQTQFVKLIVRKSFASKCCEERGVTPLNYLGGFCFLRVFVSKWNEVLAWGMITISLPFMLQKLLL